MNILPKFFSIKNHINGMNKRNEYQSGLTMIELLIVVAIIGVLLILFFSNAGLHIGRSRDAQRKGDLEKIRVAFEDYYNDNDCYPPAESLNDCNGTSLSPYLSTIPCDPVSEEPYRYYVLDGDACGGYRVLTGLQDGEDTAVVKLHCHEEVGCDPDNPGYNYGVSSGGAVADNNAWTFAGGAVNKWVCRPDLTCGNYNPVPGTCGFFVTSGECSANCTTGSSSICPEAG